MKMTPVPRQFQVERREVIKVKVIAQNTPRDVIFGSLRGSNWLLKERNKDSIEMSFEVTENTPERERFDLFMGFARNRQGRVSKKSKFTVVIEGDSGPDTYKKEVGPDIVNPTIRRYRFFLSQGGASK